MSSDRLMRRKTIASPDHTFLTSKTISSPSETGDSPQPMPPDLAHSGHNFRDISVLAQESQLDTEQEALDAEQSNEIIGRHGSGMPLAPTVRASMEGAFGYNFGQVRIHTDTEAATLSRSLDARAFTLGSDIFLSQEAASTGLHVSSPLLAHELTHVVQQVGSPAAQLAPGETLTVSDPQDTSEQEAERTAAAFTAGETHAGAQAGSALAATVQPATVARAIQREPANTAAPQTAAPTQQPAVSRNDVELLGMRLKMRQIDLAAFLNAAKNDVDNIRAYFKWVTDVYSRCYDHYDLVMKQAKQQADSQQTWIDLISGVATGLAVGLFAEVIVPFEITKKVYQFMGEAASEFAEGLVGQALKTDAPGLNAPLDLNPAFKQLVALQQLDKLNALVLSMATPGAYIFSDPIVMAERLSAELRVAEAGGQRRMTDEEVQQSYLKLMRCEVASLQLELNLKEIEPKFDALRKAYMGKQAPSDQRCEQDIWIPWIARQNPGEEGFWSMGPVLNKEIFLNHFVDIGLAARGARGGRLNADVDIHHASTDYDPDAHATRTVSTSEELVNGAKALVKDLPAYWNDVFLMGPGGDNKGP
jgi:uncharacterized protein DUF4157